MNISNLTYKELENLEEKIKERKKELEEAEYEGLVNGVLNAIKAIIEAGYGRMDACHDNNGESYTWREISYKIRQEYENGEEDY